MRALTRHFLKWISFDLSFSRQVLGDSALMHGAIHHDVSNYIFPSRVAKWREINHVNNGRRINSFTTLTPSRNFSCLNRKHIFRTLHPIIALVKRLFYARKEQWPRGWDGGIVIDHAMGWKRREREEEKKATRRKFYKFLASRRLHTQNINFRIYKLSGVGLTFVPHSGAASFRSCRRRGFIYFAVDFNFSSFFPLTALFFRSVCDAAFDEADEAQRECWRKLKSKLIVIYIVRAIYKAPH